MEHFPTFDPATDVLPSFIARLEHNFKNHKIQDDAKVSWAHVKLGPAAAGFFDELPPELTWANFKPMILSELMPKEDISSLHIQFNSLTCSNNNYPQLMLQIRKLSKKLHFKFPQEFVTHAQIDAFIKACPPQLKNFLIVQKHTSLQDVCDKAILKANAEGNTVFPTPTVRRISPEDQPHPQGQLAITASPATLAQPAIHEQSTLELAPQIIAAISNHTQQAYATQRRNEEILAKATKEKEDKLKEEQDFKTLILNLTKNMNVIMSTFRPPQTSQRGYNNPRQRQLTAPGYTPPGCWHCGGSHARRYCPQLLPTNSTSAIGFNYNRKPTLN
jgi:hypothetical protein